MNTFKISDRVKTVVGFGTPILRLNGEVKYIACQLATVSGGKTCNKNNCNHSIKDYVWVRWPTGTTIMSYHYYELDYEAGYGNTTKPVLPDAKDMINDQLHKNANATPKEIALGKMKDQISDILKPEKTFDAHKYYYGKTKPHKSSDIEKTPLTDKELTPEFWKKYTGLDWLIPNKIEL